jgi:hypothetical protein
LKPLSVYKLSRAEAALRRLEAAIDGLDAAATERAARVDDAVPAVPVVDAGEIADLRVRCAALEAAARSTSAGLGETISDLSRLLEG